MANFKAWKIYMLHLIDRLVEEHRLQGPFIDAGCGSGDVSVHFAERGWPGTAVDFSADAVKETAQRLSSYPNVRARQGDLFELELPLARTIFLMDVIEHVKEDEAFVGRVARSLAPGGHVVVTVPVNPPEWRWDDEFYGHYRRYVKPEFCQMLERSGFEVLSMWDCSFPLFWLMRRVYTRFFPKPAMGEGAPEERTKVSAQQSAWDCSHVSDWIDRIFSSTRLYLVHYPFRKGPWGCEILLVARKKTGSSV
jgi:SAM-dependent methyltransferase